VADGIMAGVVFLLAAGMFGHSLYRSTWYIFAAAGLALYRLAVTTEPPQIDAKESSKEGPGTEGNVCSTGLRTGT